MIDQKQLLNHTTPENAKKAAGVFVAFLNSFPPDQAIALSAKGKAYDALFRAGHIFEDLLVYIKRLESEIDRTS